MARLAPGNGEAEEIMSGVDDHPYRPDDHLYRLMTMAVQAAGPCIPGGEADWGRRVKALAVDLYFVHDQAAYDLSQMQHLQPFQAFLESVEIEPSTRRGLLTLRSLEGGRETIRTEQENTERGRALIDRAQALQGHLVLVFKYSDRDSPKRSYRTLAHLMDLGNGRDDARRPGEDEAGPRGGR